LLFSTVDELRRVAGSWSFLSMLRSPCSDPNVLASTLGYTKARIERAQAGSQTSPLARLFSDGDGCTRHASKIQIGITRGGKWRTKNSDAGIMPNQHVSAAVQSNSVRGSGAVKNATGEQKGRCAGSGNRQIVNVNPVHSGQRGDDEELRAVDRHVAIVGTGGNRGYDGGSRVGRGKN